MSFPDDPVDHLYHLNTGPREELQAMGVETIFDIPEGFSLTPVQERIRQSVVTASHWPGLFLMRSGRRAASSSIPAMNGE